MQRLSEKPRRFPRSPGPPAPRDRPTRRSVTRCALRGAAGGEGAPHALVPSFIAPHGGVAEIDRSSFTVRGEEML